MVFFDSLVLKGVRWALEKVQLAVEAELDEEPALKEDLLAARMKVELGEMSEEEFAAIEVAIARRLKEIHRDRRGGTETAHSFRPGTVEIETEDFLPPAVEAAASARSSGKRKRAGNGSSAGPARKRRRWSRRPAATAS